MRLSETYTCRSSDPTNPNHEYTGTPYFVVGRSADGNHLLEMVKDGSIIEANDAEIRYNGDDE